MMLCYDLHSHSTASDGVLSPEQLVQRAYDYGVNVLALTDHDGTGGITAALSAASSLGIRLIPGVEVSVTWEKRLIHIVGLGVDQGNNTLQEGLADLRQIRQARAEAIAARCEKIGIKNALEGARKYAGGEIISRTHFARYLQELGHVKDMQAAFNRYLGPRQSCYVACEWATLEQAVGWINGAGGQAVVAHPARYKMSRTKLKAFTMEFKEIGGAGIEVTSSSHNASEIKNMSSIAKEVGLLASVGSDFHDPENNWAQLGRFSTLPDECQPIWQDWS